MCAIIKFVFMCLAFLAHQVTSKEFLHGWSQEDYAKMPPKLSIHHYDHCVNQPGGVYCTAGADVVSDEPSELLDMMKEYAASSIYHFDYTKIRYGLCMTRNCREFYNGSTTPELVVAAEACLNRSLGQEYGLKTRVRDIYCYYEDQTKNKHQVDWLDWAVGAFFLAILALNVVGSVYDFTRDQTKPGDKFLLSFSCRRNWKELMAPPSLDPRAKALQSLNGVRFLTCLLIVLIHCPMPAMVAIENTSFQEKGFESSMFYFFYNGSMATQSFFLMSGFLLAYNTQMATEKESFTLKKYFKSIFLRFMRLAPMMIFSLLITATLSRLSHYGPLWQEQVGTEVDHCREHWIYNVLFLNNFIPFSTCKLESWSTASDFHLHVIGLTVVLLAPSPSKRRLALALLYLVGLAWPAYNVYTMGLDGTLLVIPEMGLEYNLHYPTFHYLYKPTYANLPVFVIGMTFGYIVYDMQKRNVTADYTKYRYWYWLLVPFLFFLLQVGGYVFYQPGQPASRLTHLLFTPIVKPLYGLTVMLIIFGAINKVETLYRGVLEWRGFVALGKLSFAVYSLHVIIIRRVAGSNSTLLHNSLLHANHSYFGIVGLSLIVALVAHLAVEAPVAALVRLAFAKQHKIDKAQ